MPTRLVSSWGNVVRHEHLCLSLASRFAPFPKLNEVSSVLPFGNGRSYGDSCLNDGAALLQMRSLDRLIHFDRDDGVITCESGVLLEDLLRVVVPAGWFPQVVPGTRYVTVGGAIANDVHGKNHHCSGTFGRHVRRFELLRSTGERLICSPVENPQWFRATIGGLGLTGVITWAELQLRPIAGPWMETETIRCANLTEFFQLNEESAGAFEYDVAWIDCLARGKGLGRALFQRGTHSTVRRATPAKSGFRWSVPFTPPISLVNWVPLRLYNAAYYRHQLSKCQRKLVDLQSFLFPLDKVRNWNRLYGPRGLYQYQCVVPTVAAPRAIAELLEAIASSAQRPFLAILKRCGSIESPGMLSFPLAGVTLAVDFPYGSTRITRLFERLDDIVRGAGGRLYPAKDGRMPRNLFRAGYPNWRQFSGYIDPQCSSTFWRRVGIDAVGA